MKLREIVTKAEVAVDGVVYLINLYDLDEKTGRTTHKVWRETFWYGDVVSGSALLGNPGGFNAYSPRELGRGPLETFPADVQAAEVIEALVAKVAEPVYM